MAYVIPVVAWLVDEKAAAALIGEPANYFENYRNDRYNGVERLARLTGAPIENFSDEDQEFFYIGIRVEDDWRIDLGPALVTKAAAIKNQHPHPLVQAAQLAVVSEFC